MMMKKSLMFILAAMVILAAGCGNKAEESAPNSSEPASVVENETAEPATEEQEEPAETEQEDGAGTIIELTKENWSTYFDLYITEKYSDDGERVKYYLSLQPNDEYMDAYIAHCGYQFPDDLDWSEVIMNPTILMVEVISNSNLEPYCIDLSYHVDYSGETYFFGTLKEDFTEYISNGGLSYTMDRVLIHYAAVQDAFREINEEFNDYWKNTPAVRWGLTGFSDDDGYYHVGIDPEGTTWVVFTKPITIDEIVIDEVQGSVMVWDD